MHVSKATTGIYQGHLIRPEDNMYFLLRLTGGGTSSDLQTPQQPPTGEHTLSALPLPVCTTSSCYCAPTVPTPMANNSFLFLYRSFRKEIWNELGMEKRPRFVLHCSSAGRKYIVIKMSSETNGLKGFNVDVMCVHVPYVASNNSKLNL